LPDIFLLESSNSCLENNQSESNKFFLPEASEAMAVKEEEAKLNTIPLNLEEEEVEDDRDEVIMINYII